MAKGKTSVVEKIRMLIELAKAAEGTAEGQTARKLAQQKLAREGLTEADVMSDRKVALGGKVAIWEQALMEISAETSEVGLEVDRDSTEWTLKGPRRQVDEAVDRFHGLRDQLLDASLVYVSTVREAMREVGDDPSLAKSVLDRMRRVFLEAASISVFGKLLERMFAPKEEREGASPDPVAEPEGEPDRKRRGPFEKLLERFERGEDTDWDFEIDVAEGTVDPSTAGYLAGAEAVLDAPFPVSKRRLAGPTRQRRLAG